tara:strand:- start:5880 stop:6461 length:582 start_codon:yes stop_codon:yes gene_type:complete
MPNWCHTDIIIRGTAKDIKWVSDLIQKHNDRKEDSMGFFETIIPSPNWDKTPNEDGELPVPDPARDADGNITFMFSKFPATGRNDDRWYDWNINNWGTKWEVSEIEVTDSSDTELYVYFDTAWSPVIPIFDKLVERGLDVEAEFKDEGWNFAGKYDNGEVEDYKIEFVERDEDDDEYTEVIVYSKEYPEGESH